MAQTVTFRPASRAYLAAVVALLADDDLGAEREVRDLAPYGAAFAEIDADPRTSCWWATTAARWWPASSSPCSPA